MNKAELIEELSGRFEGNRRAAQHALESVVEVITRQVAKGEQVAITGFGKFERRIRPAGTARNPQTGETVKTKKKSVPRFSPGAEFKAIVNGDKKLAAPAKKAAGKKTTAKKSTARKTASKSTARKTTARKGAAKKSTRKR